MSISSHRWIQLSVFNLFIVALLGTLMRYKIGFEFPYFSQKYIQEAHSHFAFTGWISHTLYVLFIFMLKQKLPQIRDKFYVLVLVLNLFSAYGMLISFFMQGYGPVSIAFSTLSLVTGYLFSFCALRDLKKLPDNDLLRKWSVVAIWFGILSSAGTAYLAYMMATLNIDQQMYLGSVYFYLHFQYNGWFFFACMGIFFEQISMFKDIRSLEKKIFWCFVLSGVPSFFLSTLWADLPDWLFVLVVIASFLQILAWWYLVVLVRKNWENFKQRFTKTSCYLLLIVGLALTIKLFLQLGSTVPAISKLAFGFRPIVIAYLHLILLLIISVFLLAALYELKLLKWNRMTRFSILGFTGAAILNEFILAIQGIASFDYIVIPYVNIFLFIAAVGLLATSCILFFSQWNRRDY